MAGLVFMCYSREDWDFVRQLASVLKQQGVPVWVDQWDISPADDWDMEVEQALSGCSHLVVVLSPDSMDSDEVLGEWRVALDDGKPVIPVLYRECRIHRRLRYIQHVDFTSSSPTDETALSQLLSVLGPVSPQPAAQQRKPAALVRQQPFEPLASLDSRFCLPVRYVNFRGERKVFAADPASIIRPSRGHLSMCVKPTGIRIALWRHKISNLAEVERARRLL